LLKILTCITKNTTFSDSYFRPVLFPNKNAPIATAIITITTTATISSVGSDALGCCEGEVGVGVAIGTFGLGIA
jgi:hypothetical protein